MFLIWPFAEKVCQPLLWTIVGKGCACQVPRWEDKREEYEGIYWVSPELIECLQRWSPREEGEAPEILRNEEDVDYFTWASGSRGIPGQI